MDTSTEQEPPRKIICPTCAKDLDPDITLWLHLGRWYCSEGCVRVALKGGGGVGST